MFTNHNVYFSSYVVTEQGDQGSLPCQPFLLALCCHSNPGHDVHALGSQHGAHHHDTATPAAKVLAHRDDYLYLLKMEDDCSFLSCI